MKIKTIVIGLFIILNTLAFAQKGVADSHTETPTIPSAGNTIEHMLSIDEYLNHDEINDILKLTAKGINSTGTLQTGDAAVSFVYQMNQADGNALIKDQVFDQFDLSASRIRNKLTINNTKFTENSVAYFKAKNSIKITHGSIIKPGEGGSFRLQVGEIDNGFSAQSKSAQLEEKLIQTDLLANSVQIYPNPVKNLMSVKSKKEIVRYQLYNKLNVNLFNVSIESEKEIEINLTSLSRDLYFLILTFDNGETVTKKIIKD